MPTFTLDLKNKMMSCKIYLYACGLILITSIQSSYTKSYVNFSDGSAAPGLVGIRLDSVVDTFSLQFEIFGILPEDNSGALMHSSDPCFLSFFHNIDSIDDTNWFDGTLLVFHRPIVSDGVSSFESSCISWIQYN